MQLSFNFDNLTQPIFSHHPYPYRSMLSATYLQGLVHILDIICFN